MNLLTIEKLTKAFGGYTALAGIDLEVSQGKIHALIGPNGAGKTTLINIISGMVRPTAGSLKFRDKPMERLGPDKIAALGIGRTFQNIRLFKSMTVMENVMVGLHCRTHVGLVGNFFRMPFGKIEEETKIREKSEELLHFVGLHDQRDQKAGSLPYGSQRNLEIARALAADPSLVLLDEPSAGMDIRETEEQAALVLEIQRRGVTVLLIEHDMGLIMGISDLITVLNFGVKIAEGKPHEIQSTPAVIEAYLGA